MRPPDKLDIVIPDFSLVVLIGASGSGKSTFAAKHFIPTEILSSDKARGIVSDDETNQDVTVDAFDLVRAAADKRLKHRKLTVIDATNVRATDRKAWVELARRWHALPVAIVIEPGIDICVERNKSRPDRPFGAGVVQRMVSEIRRGLRGLQKEGFRQVWELHSPESVEAATVRRQPLWTDKRDDPSCFDIIGDIHGCADELEALLRALDYVVHWSERDGARWPKIVPPAGRKAVFVGDLVDRGPRTPDVLRIVLQMVDSGAAYAVMGNHDRKLMRWFDGRNVKPTHGLQQSIEQLSTESAAFKDKAKTFLDSMRSHYWLDGGRLAVAHAGLKEEMIGRGSGAVREFALYGDTTGEMDEYGLPVRRDWAAEYRGTTSVVYGHVATAEAQWVNNTICIDTGCVYGGKLTALRWPERELVSVPAAKVYYESMRPRTPAPEKRSAQAEADDILDMEDVSGRRWIDTELRGRVVIAEENATAALEVMSRFAIAPQWLVYLPPTMSPCETCAREGWLERPEEAFAYFRERGVTEVVCEEKHMGSRAIIALCRSDAVARLRFGVVGPETGAIWTRTGRAFFSVAKTTEAILARLRAAVDRLSLWDQLETDWLLLDAEIMPWSAKASSLIETQYVPVAVSSRIGLQAGVGALERAFARGVPVEQLHEKFADRAQRASAYATAWEQYVWPVSNVEDLRIAPFHLLASEGRVWFDRDHVWHMDYADELATSGEKIISGTRWKLVDLTNDQSCTDAINWWEDLIGSGGEGMVVKPKNFIARGQKGLIQPALKVRGREYLRIIYGPEYDSPENLSRLRERGIGGKRNLAHREFAMGHEALRRFVASEPLRRVHECVFGVLALESEPVDPRL